MQMSKGAGPNNPSKGKMVRDFPIRIVLPALIFDFSCFCMPAADHRALQTIFYEPFRTNTVLMVSSMINESSTHDIFLM